MAFIQNFIDGPGFEDCEWESISSHPTFLGTVAFPAAVGHTKGNLIQQSEQSLDTEAIGGPENELVELATLMATSSDHQTGGDAWMDESPTSATKLSRDEEEGTRSSAPFAHAMDRHCSPLPHIADSAAGVCLEEPVSSSNDSRKRTSESCCEDDRWPGADRWPRGALSGCSLEVPLEEGQPFIERTADRANCRPQLSADLVEKTSLSDVTSADLVANGTWQLDQFCDLETATSELVHKVMQDNLTTASSMYGNSHTELPIREERFESSPWADAFEQEDDLPSQLGLLPGPKLESALEQELLEPSWNLRVQATRNCQENAPAGRQRISSSSGKPAARRGRNPLSLKPVAERSAPYPMAVRQQRLERFKERKQRGKGRRQVSLIPLQAKSSLERSSTSLPLPGWQNAATLLGDLQSVESCISECPATKVRSAAIGLVQAIRESSLRTSCSSSPRPSTQSPVVTTWSAKSPVTQDWTPGSTPSGPWHGLSAQQTGGIWTEPAQSAGTSQFADIVTWSLRMKEELSAQSKEGGAGGPDDRQIRQSVSEYGASVRSPPGERLVAGGLSSTWSESLAGARQVSFAGVPVSDQVTPEEDENMLTNPMSGHLWVPSATSAATATNEIAELATALSAVGNFQGHCPGSRGATPVAISARDSSSVDWDSNSHEQSGQRLEPPAPGGCPGVALESEPDYPVVGEEHCQLSTFSGSHHSPGRTSWSHLAELGKPGGTEGLHLDTWQGPWRESSLTAGTLSADQDGCFFHQLPVRTGSECTLPTSPQAGILCLDTPLAAAQAHALDPSIDYTVDPRVDPRVHPSHAAFLSQIPPTSAPSFCPVIVPVLQQTVFQDSPQTAEFSDSQPESISAGEPPPPTASPDSTLQAAWDEAAAVASMAVTCLTPWLSSNNLAFPLAPSVRNFSTTPTPPPTVVQQPKPGAEGICLLSNEAESVGLDEVDIVATPVYTWLDVEGTGLGSSENGSESNSSGQRVGEKQGEGRERDHGNQSGSSTVIDRGLEDLHQVQLSTEKTNGDRRPDLVDSNDYPADRQKKTSPGVQHPHLAVAIHRVASHKAPSSVIGCREEGSRRKGGGVSVSMRHPSHQSRGSIPSSLNGQQTQRIGQEAPKVDLSPSETWSLLRKSLTQRGVLPGRNA